MVFMGVGWQGELEIESKNVVYSGDKISACCVT